MLAVNSSDGIHDNSSQSELAEVGKGVLLSGITIAAVIGNSLSLLALFLTKKWHTRHLIVSLAITDFLLGVFVMPFTTVSAVKNCWVFSKIGCDIQGSLGFLFCQVSVTTITCVSLERYILFSKPSLHFHWVKRSTKAMEWLVLGTWVYGGIWTFLAWQTTHFSYQRELLNCAVRWRKNYLFTLICGIITSCVPITLILCCNFKVALKVTKMAKRMNLTRDRTESDTMKRTITEVKVSRMLLAVTIAFLVCWTPYSIGGLCYLLPRCTWPDGYFKASVFFCLFNSAINPILYGAFDRRFRKALSYLFGKIWRTTPTAKSIRRVCTINVSQTRATPKASPHVK